MSAVTIFEARQRLAADLLSIDGIKRVYETIAEELPSNPDCPCFELAVREPMLSVRGGVAGQTEDTMMLDLAFLFKARNLGKPIENIQAIDRFILLTKAKLYANFTGAGLYLINKDTGTLDFTAYLLTKNNAPTGTTYWGFKVTLDLTMLVDTTVAAGT